MGNIYLHYVLDEWFEGEVRPQLKGRAVLVRYADDFVIGFEHEGDAKRVMEALLERVVRFGLTLHPDKTRLLPFSRPKGQSGGKGPGTFDFLGFTHYWRRTRIGTWEPTLKTRSARLRRSIQAVAEYCRSHRHDPVKQQRDALARRLNGHYNYFGVNGNNDSLQRLFYEAKCAWKKWLERRGQRAKIGWERFAQMLKQLPLPAPKIKVQLWA